jgi:glyoxalase family protein
MISESQEILGIHHVTAIASDPQRTYDFYGQVLGLRMVKKTVNFDDPTTYHFYFGDECGRPGTVLTFFPWPGARRGSRGSGQVTVTSLAVPTGSLDFWQQRLSEAGVIVEAERRRFREDVMTVVDPDGLVLELTAAEGATLLPAWAEGPVPVEHAIRGLHGVTMVESDEKETVDFLQSLGFSLRDRQGERSRFDVGSEDGGVGRWLDVVWAPDEPRGRIAAGTVHHVAWRVADAEAQEAWLERLSQQQVYVTPVQDRSYFQSIYFREPGGVLFEIATDSPGFMIDEALSELGSGLRLPAWLEPSRQRIEASLPPLQTPMVAS